MLMIEDYAMGLVACLTFFVMGIALANVFFSKDKDGRAVQGVINYCLGLAVFIGFVVIVANVVHINNFKTYIAANFVCLKPQDAAILCPTLSNPLYRTVLNASNPMTPYKNALNLTNETTVPDWYKPFMAKESP